MSIEVKIPSVGESVSSGVISRWHKSNGEAVKTGEVLLTLETDKVSTEITADANGTVELLVEEGREVQVGEVVARIKEADQTTPASDPEAASPEQVDTREPSSQDQAEAVAPPAQPANEGMQTEPEPASPESAAAPAPALDNDTDIGRHGPSVARVMRQEGISAAEVEERTGLGGRITREDLEEFIKRRTAAQQTAEPAPPPASQESPASADAPAAAAAPAESLAPQASAPATPAALTVQVPGGLAPDLREGNAEAMTTRKAMSPLRRKIAQQLVAAQRQAALLTTFNECDMSAVIAIRSRMQESFQARHGIKLGFMSFFVKAVVNALQEVPAVNARIDGDDLVQHHYYDIGVAVGTDRGLLVPVLRRADTKSFAALEKEMGEYAARARDGKIQIDDLRGGVFTITNGGIYGSLMSTPIVNPPQSGILGMHAIKERPVVVEGEIVVRPMMYLALTYDHRVIDGKEAVTFLVRVKEAIEDPMQLIL